MSAAAKSGDTAKTRGKLPLILGLVVLLAGAGGGYYWWSAQQAAQAAAGAAGKVAKAARSADAQADGEAHDDEHAGEADVAGHGVLLPLQSFTVNLADPETSRFLRTDVQLVLAADESALKALEHEKVPVVRARAAVLELLSEQTSAVINTPEGKAALKKQIATTAGKVLRHKVSDVLFSDFVIQF
jgi:flagellar protein FliL